jgi:hypothetical protein
MKVYILNTHRWPRMPQRLHVQSVKPIRFLSSSSLDRSKSEKGKKKDVAKFEQCLALAFLIHNKHNNMCSPLFVNV